MQPGDRIGPYVVERRLGSGQMGVVFAVRHPDIDARYAVKVLRRELCAARDLLRFQREIELLAAVSKHPNVVPIHSAGEDRCGLYFVMDLVEGPTLQELLAKGGAMPPERAARYVCDIASALTALHRAGIVHRDIKPSNVLVDARDSVRLADFGLARVFADDKGRLTNTGELVGTPHYMAPEQALGFQVGPPADVYSLGMVLFTLLAGRPAVEGKGLLEVLTRVGSGELLQLPRLAPDTPDALLSVISRCLKRDAELRPTADVVVEALDAFLRVPPAQRPRSRRTSPVVVGLSVLAGVSVLGGLAALAAARRVAPPLAGDATAAAPVTTTLPPKAPAERKPPPLVRLEKGDVEELRQVLAGVDALGVENVSATQREALRASLMQLERQWVDPNGGAMWVGDVVATALALERLVWIHALLRRLDPAHRLPASRRPCLDFGIFPQLGAHQQRLGPPYFAELVALMPDDVNAHVMYCDATRDAFRFRAVVDLDVLRRGVALARESDKEAAWGRMLHALASHLWARSDQPQAVAELKALIATALTSAWTNDDLLDAVGYLLIVLTNGREFDEALALVKTARERAPTEPLLVGRSVVVRVIRAAVAIPPPADEAWLPETMAATAEYFELLSRSPEKDEHVTSAVLTTLSPALEARGKTAEAEALCAKALNIHPPIQTLPAVAGRRVMLLCRLEAPTEVLVQALDDLVARLTQQKESLEGLRGFQPSPEFRARVAALEEAKVLTAGVRAGSIARAEVALRLAKAFRLSQMIIDLQPARPR